MDVYLFGMYVEVYVCWLVPYRHDHLQMMKLLMGFRFVGIVWYCLLNIGEFWQGFVKTKVSMV